LLSRFRLRPRLPEWAIWHAIALAGVVLALGSNTPVGNVLVHIPLFGDQRLQSRNVLVLDVALAVLLAHGADQLARERHVRDTGRFPGYFPVRRTASGVLLGVLPALATVTIVVLAYTWGAGLLEWLGVDAADSTRVIGPLRPCLIPSAVLGAGAAALVIVIRHVGPRWRSGLMCGFVVADVLVFTVLGVVQVGHGVSGSSVAAAGAGGSQTGLSGSQTSVSSAQAGGTTTAAAITATGL
jgi:hypothetical protein